MWETALRFVSALWNVVGILLAAVLVIELGLPWLREAGRRLRYGEGGKPNTRAAGAAYGGADWPYEYEREFERLLAFDPKPFVHWTVRPCRGAYTNVGEDGYRVVPGAELAGRDDLKVHCFGGSTMFGLGARDEGTIPAALQRLLRARGHDVAVANRGQLGHISTQEIISLQQSLKHGARPDVALFFDGYNDLQTAEWSGRADSLMNDDIRSAEFDLLGKERRGDLLRAALQGAMPRTLRYVRKLTGIDLRGTSDRHRPVGLSEDQLAPLARSFVAVYAANVRLARLLARDCGFEVIFVWQPMLASKKIKSPDEKKWESIDIDVALRRRFLATVVAELRRCPGLAGAPDVVDLSALFDEEARAIYIDYCHLSEEGNAVVAEALVPALEQALAAALSRRRVGALSMSGERR